MACSAVFCTGHGPLQFPAEVWWASRAFYTQSTQLTPTPCLHILTVTQICTRWWTHIQICIHWHRPTLNWTTHNYSTLFLSFVLYYDTHWHCSVLLFVCTGLNTHASWRKKKIIKLKHTTKTWNWPYLTSYQIGPIINQFFYLHYSILSISCACPPPPPLSLSLSILVFSFFLQLLCTNMKKVAVQSSLQYKQAETRDSVKKQFLAFRGEMSPASEISLPEADTHTSVVFVKFTRLTFFNNNNSNNWILMSCHPHRVTSGQSNWKLPVNVNDVSR